MKKFSTAAAFIAFASVFLPLTSLVASPVAQAAEVYNCAFRPDAPDQHVVVSGDTLWGISSKFLEHAWCWPQVWGMNREEIQNPHWIYPGQVVYFDRAAGRLRLGKVVGGQGSDNGTIRVSPQSRTLNLDHQEIPSIPANLIEPFLSQPLIIEEEEFKNTPHIVAPQDDRVVLGAGDKAYVRGDLKGGTSFQVFHPGHPLIDPDTKKTIGYEAVYLGTVKLQRAAKTEDEAHVFTVVNVKEEIRAGDRLVPVVPTPMISYVPHPPTTEMKARVVAIYGGVSEAGQNDIVSINRGKKDGVDVGTVLELYRFGKTIVDQADDKKRVKLPDQQYGTLFIFRVFNNISYGLIMQVSDSLNVGDVARSPE